jgi:hypothetical protein
VISGFRACCLAQSLAMVIAWHQGFRAYCCLGAGKTKKRDGNDPFLCETPLLQYPGAKRKRVLTILITAKFDWVIWYWCALMRINKFGLSFCYYLAGSLSDIQWFRPKQNQPTTQGGGVFKVPEPQWNSGLLPQGPPNPSMSSAGPLLLGTLILSPLAQDCGCALPSV